jgi:hypothetical protein
MPARSVSQPISVQCGPLNSSNSRNYGDSALNCRGFEATSYRRTVKCTVTVVPALFLVAVEQGAGGVGEDGGELPAEIVGVLNTGVAANYVP